MNKVIFLDENDKNFEIKKEYFDSLIDCKKLISNFNYLDLKKQSRILRETYPISLSPNKNNYLPYFEINFDKDINFAWNRLKKLWKDDCQFKSQCNVLWSPARSTGNIYPEYMIIGLNPGLGDYLKTKEWGAFWSGNGPSTTILRNALEKLNILSKYWFTNLTRCATIQNQSPTEDTVRNCYNNWLQNEINILKPKKIFTLGRDCIKFIYDYNHDVIPIKHPSYYARKGIGKEYYKEFERYL